MNLEGNTILITGGSKGIGLALTQKLVDKNEIIICGRSKEALDEAKKLYPKIHTVVCDLGNEKEIVEFANYIKENFKNLNILVNNAGIQRDVDFSKENIDLDNFSEIKINLEAPIHLIQLLLGTIRKNNNPVIINVSSGLAFMTLARVPMYCATKAAMHSFTKSLRYQLKEEGIKVIEIIPPAVDTNLNPEGRAKVKFDMVGVDEYIDEVMIGLKEGKDEIGFGGNLERINISTKKDLEKIFGFMNK